MKVFEFLSAIFMLTRCQTLEGLGKDIKRGGNTLEKAAK